MSQLSWNTICVTMQMCCCVNPIGPYYIHCWKVKEEECLLRVDNTAAAIGPIE